MDHRVGDPLHGRLDTLEGTGRAALLAAARRVARGAALRAAALASVAAPLMILLAAFVRPVDAVAAVLVSVAVPPIVFAAVWARRMAGVRISRATALGWLDRSAGLKDRARTAAEFLDDAQPDAFRAAAIDEARPWLERAEPAMPSAMHAPVRPAWWWALPLAAIGMLVAALLIDRGSSDGRDAPGRSPLRQIATALGVRTEPRADRPTETASTASRGARGPSDGTAAATGAVGARAGRAGAAGGDRRSGGADGSPSRDAASGAASPGGSDASASASGPAGAAGDAGSAKTGGATAAGQPARADDARAQRTAEAAKGSSAAATATRAQPPQGGASAAAAASTQSPGAPPAAQKAGGTDPQQQSGSRNRSSSGQQSGGPGSAGNTNSSQGSNRGTGQEGLKRARGSSSLLLAVPMEDRVIGTINAGSVAASTRRAPPRSMAAGTVAAQSRGAGAPQVGRILHRPRTVQEDRMLEGYFRRAGVGR
ncbi:MAG: hypothetical protein PGN23_09105 [Sphingomonas adhaesiva]|uniref:hypothetical protein n=1 Tax=Sphingomonas adhaesiva TaxID=28212 RepID=UPI002FF4F6F1